MSLFNTFAFAFCKVFGGTAEHEAFAGKSKSEQNASHKPKVEIYMNYVMDPEYVTAGQSMAEYITEDVY